MSAPQTQAFQEGPLAGVRVIELGSTVAGPFCGRLLADFGAEVIKVEAAEGDTVRSMGKRFKDCSLYAASIFRNKSLVSVDLRTEKGQELIRALAKESDIVIENFRPGTLERWKIGYTDLAAINPRIIMIRISGFGQDGPYSSRPGFGVIGEAVSGLRHLTGDPDRPPARVAVSLTDYITGLYAAFGAVMALRVQKETGQGQFIDAALYESAFSFMEPHIPAFEKLGHIAKRAGSKLPDNTPNNLYPTKDGSFIHIAAIGESVFRRFTQVMGQPALPEDPRFRTAVERSRHENELDGYITQWTNQHDLAELEQVLERAEVPATRIFTMKDIFSDPHFAARKAMVDAPHAQLGSVRMANVTPRLSRTPGRIRHAGGTVGQDTRAVIKKIVGLTDAQIDQLAAAGVIACEPLKSKTD